MIAVPILIALCSGLLLGGFYFGGLWFAVRRVSTALQPELLLFVSFVVRSVVVLFGFYFVMGGRWERLVAGMVGFLVARSIWIRRMRNACGEADPRRVGTTMGRAGG